MSVREREDVTNSDISPVPVSEFVDDSSGRPDEDQANKNPKTNKKETTMERGNPSDSETRNGCKNSGKIRSMMKFHYREAVTQVLLMKFLLVPTAQRREDLGKTKCSYSFPSRPKLRDL